MRKGSQLCSMQRLLRQLIEVDWPFTVLRAAVGTSLVLVMQLARLTVLALLRDVTAGMDLQRGIVNLPREQRRVRDVLACSSRILSRKQFSS